VEGEIELFKLPLPLSDFVLELKWNMVFEAFDNMFFDEIVDMALNFLFD